MEYSKKHAQIQAIKMRLNEAVNRSGMNMHQLTSAINNADDIEVNYNTVTNVLNYKKDALDITTVIAICRYLHLDTAMIMSPPETKDTTLQSVEDFLSSGKFTILDDPKFLGRFHCFFYSPNHRSSELIRFELEIGNENGKISATMYYHGKPVSVEGEELRDTRILYGTPFLDTRHSNIFILFTNDTGDFYFLYYSWQKFRSHSLYYRRGIALTSSSLRDNPVLFMNFVLFALPVSNQDIPYVSGLLTDVSPVFYVPRSTMEILRKENTLVETFYQQFSYILEHDALEVYPVNETQILASSHPQMDGNDVVKAILLLKDASLAPKRIVYEDIESYSAFSKNYLQKAKREEQT